MIANEAGRVSLAPHVAHALRSSWAAKKSSTSSPMRSVAVAVDEIENLAVRQQAFDFLDFEESELFLNTAK